MPTLILFTSQDCASRVVRWCKGGGVSFASMYLIYIPHLVLIMLYRKNSKLPHRSGFYKATHLKVSALAKELDCSVDEVILGGGNEPISMPPS